MIGRYPRGSLWRKWDLHVHAPGTKLSDGYASNGDQDDFDRFCRIIHDSDVAVVGIADYFSLDSFFAVKDKYSELYPGGKLLLPNLELRLPVSVNRAAQNVNLHLIFRPTLTRDEADKFLRCLKTEGTTGVNSTRTTCAELSRSEEIKSATVSLQSIEEAIKDTFGEHAVHRSERIHHLIVVTSAKGDGIRVGGTSGIKRKNLLSDEIDKYSDAFFANAGSRDYFLNIDRLEGDVKTGPKPVFDGCDAHSFDDLEAKLGKHVTSGNSKSNVTWLKADTSYVGLLQTLIEPVERVRMQATEPDQKERYRVIDRVTFTGTNDFPEEILFNRNLNSVIGSRSSGKSALLAFIAHATDPVETVKVQTEAGGLQDEKEAGPAAGFTWEEVDDVVCSVEWASGQDTAGRVIYIPQNSLYMLSERPDDITKKIKPVLFRAYPKLRMAFERRAQHVDVANATIKNGVDEWFRLVDKIDQKTKEILDVGDKTAISGEKDRLQGEIDRIKTDAKLTDAEVAKYQEVERELASSELRIAELDGELSQLSSFVATEPASGVHTTLAGSVRVAAEVRPARDEVPEWVAMQIDDLKNAAVDSLTSKIEDLLVKATEETAGERRGLVERFKKTRTDNAELIAKHQANEELAGVVAEHKNQLASLKVISKREDELEDLATERDRVSERILSAINDREAALSAFESEFKEEDRVHADLSFGVESDVTDTDFERACGGISRRSVNDYIPARGDSFAYDEAQADPAKFLDAIRDEKVKVNKGSAPRDVAAEVLTLTKDTRFSAELDGDRIGGFERSTMTPGKQALFALTLILNESEEPWPLLIDQPEDDLDSRSIYETIVPYLVERKKERQIIMVSHNANLVIGADSEEVIVANRHGEDRQNADRRTFDYLSGALEDSRLINESSASTLGRFGVREHACEILDGGEEAFRKRREKYRLRVEE